jgi:hypothetical protein
VKVELSRFNGREPDQHRWDIETAPLDLRIVSRMLFHAALVGVAAGVAGALFFGSLEYLQRFLLEGLAGYRPLRAAGETFAASGSEPGPFRPWLLVLLPALDEVLGVPVVLSPRPRSSWPLAPGEPKSCCTP